MIFKAQNLQLDAEDKKAIAALDCNDRLVSPEGLAPESGLSLSDSSSGSCFYMLAKEINKARMRVLTARSL